MRIAKVIGKLTLNRQVPDLVAGTYLLVQTCGRKGLAGGPLNRESLVVYDCLAASEGDLIGLVEGREATAPFFPKKVPYDCYNAAILDDVDFDPVLKDATETQRAPKQKK